LRRRTQGPRARPDRTAALPPPARSPLRRAHRARAPSRHAPGSRIDPPGLQCGTDLVDPGNECGLSQGDALRLGKLPHPVERVTELFGEPRADLVARPEEAAEILHPLEV